MTMWVSRLHRSSGARIPHWRRGPSSFRVGITSNRAEREDDSGVADLFSLNVSRPTTIFFVPVDRSFKSLEIDQLRLPAQALTCLRDIGPCSRHVSGLGRLEL